MYVSKPVKSDSCWTGESNINLVNLGESLGIDNDNKKNIGSKYSDGLILRSLGTELNLANWKYLNHCLHLVNMCSMVQSFELTFCSSLFSTMPNRTLATLLNAYKLNVVIPVSVPSTVSTTCVSKMPSLIHQGRSDGLLTLHLAFVAYTAEDWHH